jgi:hypothetical protein
LLIFIIIAFYCFTGFWWGQVRHLETMGLEVFETLTDALSVAHLAI